MFNSLRVKFLLPLLLGGVVLALLGSWLSYQSTMEQLRKQLLQRAFTLGTAIDEAIKIARNDVEIHFAVENIVKKETGIIGITVATKSPFVIWASSFHSKTDRDSMTKNMLKQLKPSIQHGIFGHQFNLNGDLEMLLPLSPLHSDVIKELNFSKHFYASQKLVKAGEELKGYQFLPSLAYRGSIHLIFDWSEIQQSSAGLFWFSILTLLSGIVVITLITTFILYRTVFNPLDIIQKIIKQQYKGERSARIPLLAQDEIGELGLAFNAMLNAITESEEHFKSLTENTRDSIIRYDKQCRHLYMNPAAIKLFDLLGKDTRNKTYKELGFKAINGEFFEEQINTVFKTAKSSHTIFDWEGKQGAVTLDWNLFPEYDENNKIKTVLGITHDITELKEQEKKIQYQAHFDSLTDIANRFLSLDRLSQLISEAQRKDKILAVLFLDLDDFKIINDSLGHEAGDKLLIEAGQRLSREVRSGDTVGRLGGDEFIVLLDDLDEPSDAASIATNLLSKFRVAFKIDGRELLLTVSMGISIFPGDGDSASELLKNADLAMYHSKKLGRNTFSFFTEEMNSDVLRRLDLEEQMHGALERNEFTVVYQPKIDLADNTIMGAEALLRWYNPALGHITPDEFIPIAEQTGLIIAIGKFVLTQALSTTAHWHQSLNTKFHIAVNLSPRQFRDPDLVPFIQQTMRQFNISAEHLEMEITEGLLMHGHGYIDEALTVLSQLGVGIAMDDFGTGYSSLSYLRSYPFNVLKVDRSFVNDITTDEADRELIMAAIAMAHGLKLKVVAEGIETEEQLAYLKQLNCNFGQGYLFSKPILAKEMTQLLESGV